jgi:hypothetical protein
MTPQQQCLLDRLHEAGWELASTVELDDWWADEVWLLQSVLAPQHSTWYLTFLVDPQFEAHRKRMPGERVWAVLASVSLPKKWQWSEGELTFSLGHGWAERIKDFVADLSRFRHKPTA